MIERKTKTMTPKAVLSQMSLDLFCASQEPDTTRSLRIYDLAPKYCYDKPVTPLSDAKVASFTRPFSIKGHPYEVTVQAATITDPKGVEQVAFPAGREELVEAALRKMALSGSAINHKGSLGVKFSIYDLKQELAQHGHKASHNDIKRSILILRRSTLRITDQETGKTWEENFFPQLAVGGWADGPGSEYSKWYVSFHSLVTDNITNLQYRDMNYPDLMAIKGMLARYIFQRMVSVYTYANPKEPYQPTRNQLLTESGKGLTGRSSALTEQVKRALGQLMDQRIIEHWDITKRDVEGKKTVNVHYNIFPTKRFVRQVIRANDQERQRTATVTRSRLAEVRAGLEGSES